MNTPQVYGPTRLIYEAYVAMLRLCLSNKRYRYLQTYTQTLMLTQCSIVANLFDLVYAYLFQFKAFVVHTPFADNERSLSIIRDICAHVEMSATRINQNCFPVGILSNVHVHIPIILNRLHFFGYFLNFTLLLLFFLLKFTSAIIDDFPKG